MPSRKHDQIAETIAKQLNVPYNKGKGPDITTPYQVVEVEIDSNKLSEGIRQLQGFKKPRYLAVPNKIVKQAVDRTKQLKVGVLNERGQKVKPATPPKGSAASSGRRGRK